nr:dTDP-4-dehydrorhamnose reductase [Brevundimonas diminuta]
MTAEGDILITGGGGQLGRALARAAWPEGVRIHALDRSALDVTCAESVGRIMAQRRWALVINAAAFTDVEGAEDAPVQAFRVNALAPAVLAQAARAAGAPLIHVSTDFVFGGPGPHAETAAPDPLNVYGASKRAGELAVLSATPDALVVRTAWLFDSEGRNFVGKLLARAAEPQLDVVTDEVGSPTAARDLAEALVRLTLLRLEQGAFGPERVLHVANDGWASRYEMAQAVFEAWTARTGRPAPRLRPVSAAVFPSKARRPGDSRLSCEVFARVAGRRPRSWRAATQEVVREIAEAWTPQTEGGA